MPFAGDDAEVPIGDMMPRRFDGDILRAKSAVFDKLTFERFRRIPPAMAERGIPMAGIAVPEYLGISPRLVDTTAVGGSSYEFHAAHAARDIAAGRDITQDISTLEDQAVIHQLQQS